MGVRVQSLKARGSGAAPGAVFKAALHSGGWDHCALPGQSESQQRGQRARFQGRMACRLHALLGLEEWKECWARSLEAGSIRKRHLGTMASAGRVVPQAALIKLLLHARHHSKRCTCTRSFVQGDCRHGNQGPNCGPTKSWKGSRRVTGSWSQIHAQMGF